jgi:acetyl/propionyl-CoA carboxylase alpha subunit
VTEASTGVDIVRLQLRVAAGGKLAEIAPEAPAARRHAIEARLTAEDPERGFAPAPGLIEYLVLPSGPGIRVDTGVAAGDVIPGVMQREERRDVTLDLNLALSCTLTGGR